MSKDQYLNRNDWYRAGRGKGREYETIVPDDVPVILAELPPEYGPYIMFSSSMVQVSEYRYEDVCRVIRPDEVQSHVERGIWDFFLVSTVLSPCFSNEDPAIDSATLSLNGSINLQFGVLGKYGPATTSIGHVDHVCNDTTGEHLTFPEYSEVFKAAIKAAGRLAKARRRS